ncbi:MAG: glycine betaine ABC transporter substrate-binding protein [Chloroflexota bacterium]
MDEQETNARRALNRRSFLELTAAGLAGVTLLGAAQPGSIARAAPRLTSGKTLTLGNIGWDENLVDSNLTKILLEQDLGYSSVQLKLADVGLLFEGVAKGDLAAFQDVWMPNHAAFLAKVKSSVELLHPWFVGKTKFSLAAPSYMHVTSIDQLNSTKATEIYGIEPGAAITPKIKDNVLPMYHLKMKFLPSSTAAMLAQVAKAYKAREPFVFVAWSPHWMNQKYKFNYLADPKGALGTLTKPSRVTAIVHKGLKQSDPVAYTLIKSIKLTEKQVNEIELLTYKIGGDYAKGVQNWIKANRGVVRPWVDAAKKAK